MFSTGKASAMVLAAGRGERMRPLTDTCPKPLLMVHGKPLMQWHMHALCNQGFSRQLVNTAWLGEQIEAYFQREIGIKPLWNMREQLLNSERLYIDPPFTAQILYSHEGRDFGAALETAGGICRALAQLEEVFWVVAGDIYAPTFAFHRAVYDAFAVSDKLAHIFLVPNPAHNLRGDFGLSVNGLALNLPKDAGHALYTFSTIALYKQAFFAPPICTIERGNPSGAKAPLAPLLRAAMDSGLVSAELFTGDWTDVGTPARLAELNGSAGGSSVTSR